MANIQISITEAQFKQMVADFNAKDERRQRMTQSEIETLASKVNKEIDIPIISEKKEGKILLKIILKVDRFLYDNLPNELYDLIRSLDDGISEKEAKTLVKRLAKLANKNIDIPYIPEPLEYVLFNLIISLVINAMRHMWNVEIACEKVSKNDIPDNLDDGNLEKMIISE